VRTHRNLFQTATRLISLVGAAGNAAAAAHFGRQPRNQTLEKLGIDPEKYRKIGY
jgi:adenylosuccinate lyase